MQSDLAIAARACFIGLHNCRLQSVVILHLPLPALLHHLFYTLALCDIMPVCVAMKLCRVPCVISHICAVLFRIPCLILHPCAKCIRRTCALLIKRCMREAQPYGMVIIILIAILIRLLYNIQVPSGGSRRGA